MQDPAFLAELPHADRAVGDDRRAALPHPRRDTRLAACHVAGSAERAVVRAAASRASDERDPGAPALVTMLWHGRLICIRTPEPSPAP
jgi:hypothetical protein